MNFLTVAMAVASNIFVIEDSPEKPGFGLTGRRPGVSLFTSPRRQFAPNIAPRKSFLEAGANVVMLSDDEDDYEPSSQATGVRQPAGSLEANPEKGRADAKASSSLASKSKVFGNDFWELARKKRGVEKASQPAIDSLAASLPGRQAGQGTSHGEPVKGSPQGGARSASKKAARHWFLKDASLRIDADVGDRERGHVAQQAQTQADAQMPVKPVLGTVPARSEAGRIAENGGARIESCGVPKGYHEPIDLSDDEERLGSPGCGTPPLTESPESGGQNLRRGLEKQASSLGGGGGGLCKAKLSLEDALRKCITTDESEKTALKTGLSQSGRPDPTQSQKQPLSGGLLAGGSAAAASGATELNPGAWWESGDAFGGPMSQEEDSGEFECLASTQERNGKEGEAQGGEKRKKKALLTEEEKSERAAEKAREREEKARRKAQEQEAKKRKREVRSLPPLFPSLPPTPSCFRRSTCPPALTPST